MGLGRMLDDTVGAERAEFPMLYPALWEMKALNNKSWNDTRCKGVEKSKPVYYVQMQTYMAYLGLGDYQIGRAHVCTPVANAHLVRRLLHETQKHTLLQTIQNY